MGSTRLFGRMFALAVGIVAIAAMACGTGNDPGEQTGSARPEAPDFTIPVVRATEGDIFEPDQFTLSGETGNPVLLYFSFPG